MSGRRAITSRDNQGRSDDLVVGIPDESEAREKNASRGAPDRGSYVNDLVAA